MAFKFRFQHDKGPASLANRILVLQLVWAVIVYLLFITALWFATNLVIESNIRHQGEGWVSKLDELGIMVYASNNTSQIADATRYIRNFPEVLRAQYLDLKGKKIISEYTRSEVSISNFAPLTNESIENLKRTDISKREIRFEKGSNAQVRITAPIWIKSIKNDGMVAFSLKNKTEEKIETIGFIDIVLDYSQTYKELNHNLIYASIVIALLMIASTYFGQRMVRWALRPLSDLEDPLTRLANGETDVTVKTSGDKEIARIGMALNTTISALKERDESLRSIANHDGLTGLVNRKYFVEQLDKEVSRISSNGGSSALFFFDLDRFKYINDTYGHAAGDRLLIQISKQLTVRARDRDLVARFGGDEFTLLAYNATRESAHEIAEAFIQLMRDFIFYEAGDMLKIHFSIGISVIDDSTLNSQDYLKEADAAVHDAKSHGRNGFKIYNRSSSRSTQESGTGWHLRLKDVLNKNSIQPYYQPLIGLKNQTEKIYEVFLRIPDLEQGVINPSAFMPSAERFGLMTDFDKQMIQNIGTILTSHTNLNTSFSLNLSEQVIEDKGFIEFLNELIDEHHVPANRLIFELPEHNIMRNFDRLKMIIPSLSELGFRFAIDDFGSGFGSFNYIKHFPVHFIKLNSSLIEFIKNDNIDRISVHSIVDIAAELKILTVAKFATDQESVDTLRNLGIDYVQGYFVGAPTPTFN